MLYYTEICLSPYEVPNHNSICIYISGCNNNCNNCHYPILKQNNYGDKLLENFCNIIHLYKSQATCICFLGEGKNTKIERKEFSQMVEIAKKHNLKTCLYCGRDTNIEKWMHIFDFIKLGSYKEKYGCLSCRTTNQKLLEKTKNEYIDITYKFWN